jgi:hypothetical protein
MRLPSQGRKNDPSKKPSSRGLQAGYLLGVLFYPDDRSDMFLRNASFSVTTRRNITEDLTLHTIALRA